MEIELQNQNLKLNNSILRISIITVVLMATVPMYYVFLVLSINTDATSDGIKNLSSAFQLQGVNFLAALAFISLALSYILPKIILNRNLKAHKEINPSQIFAKYFVAYIVGLSLLESVVVIGFAAAYLNMYPPIMLVFAIPALLAMVMRFPRLNSIQTQCEEILCRKIDWSEQNLVIENSSENVNKSKSYSRPAAIVSAVMMFYFVSTIVIWVFAESIYHPLRSAETFLVVAVATSFVWIPITQVCYRMSFLLDYRRSKHFWFLWILCAIPACLLTVSGAYILNANLDRSLEEVQILTVTGRDYSSHKNSVRYFATVPCITPSRFSKSDGFAFDYSEKTSISKKEYMTLIPGRSQMTFVTKKGYFNIPWVVTTSISINNEVAEKTKAMDPDYVLGLKYFKGDGVAKDLVKAFQYFEIAANNGDASAQHDLAYMYSTGEGVERDDKKAFEWLKKSAEQGNAVAQDDLGVVYGDGRGVAQDWIQSYRWISLSLKQGNERAVKDIEFVKSHMTAEQIKDAEKLLSNQ